jgi:uncharacterized protein (TIGR02444 family)
LYNKTSSKKFTHDGLPSHEFWHYSLKLYSKIPVKDACLHLQNFYGVDVNLILFCCWLAVTERGQISSQQWPFLLSQVDTWQRGIVGGLRNIRSLLSNFSDLKWASELRKEILLCELTGEHIEQLMLAEIFLQPVLENRSTQQKITDCIQSLQNYIACLNLHKKSKIYEPLQVVLVEVFPNSVESIRIRPL